jgi:hypothetical protein
MASLSAMIQLELPHINVLTKVDLLPNKRDIDRFLDPDVRLLLEDLNTQTAPRFKKLNRALAELVCIHLHSYNTRHPRNNDLA